MHPLLLSEPKLDSLRPFAAKVIGRAKDLAAHGMPHLRELLREALRPMNSYYTNKIEGQYAEPLLIERALQQDFSKKPGEARKQRIAVALIVTERWGEVTFPTFNSNLSFIARLDAVCRVCVNFGYGAYGAGIGLVPLLNCHRTNAVRTHS